MNPEVAKFKEELKNSFPLSSVYKRDKAEYFQEYIRTIRKWATENLGVIPL